MNTENGAIETKSIAESIAESTENQFRSVTFESCDHVKGPFFHGTKSAFNVGDELVPGHPSNYQAGRTSNHIYFATLLEPAIWAAELAVALSSCEERGRVYIVEPTASFEDDPNLTNKKFPGNPSCSYRTRHPVRVVSELRKWEEHSPAILQAMLDNLARLREQGLDVIED
jgi:Rifampin ADP-ribosyl transferase